MVREFDNALCHAWMWQDKAGYRTFDKITTGGPYTRKECEVLQRRFSAEEQARIIIMFAYITPKTTKL